jgi:hypothetical protein
MAARALKFEAGGIGIQALPIDGIALRGVRLCLLS